MASIEDPGSPSSLTYPDPKSVSSTPEPTDINSPQQNNTPSNQDSNNNNVHYNAYGFLLDKLSGKEYHSMIT